MKQIKVKYIGDHQANEEFELEKSAAKNAVDSGECEYVSNRSNDIGDSKDIDVSGNPPKKKVQRNKQ